MNALSLALLIFRRNFFYALFVIFGVAFLLYVATGFLQYSRHVKVERQALTTIQADVIAPKGSSIEHLRRLLRLEIFSEPALIPSQLYTTLTTDTPPGLELVPVLFWGSYKKQIPVIASNLKLQRILGAEFLQLEHLNDREVIVGKQAAERFGLKVGDSIELTTEFGTLTGSSYADKFVVKSVEELGAWDGAAITSLDHVESVLSKVEFVPSQIWKNLILSYIFVTGPDRWVNETAHLIDKRTVAQYLRLSVEIPGLLKLSGIDEKLELEVLIFALLSSLIALFAFLAIWIPILGQIYKKLLRSGYSTHQLLLCFQTLGFFLLILAAGISLACANFLPII